MKGSSPAVNSIVKKAGRKQDISSLLLKVDGEKRTYVAKTKVFLIVVSWS